MELELEAEGEGEEGGTLAEEWGQAAEAPEKAAVPGEKYEGQEGEGESAAPVTAEGERETASPPVAPPPPARPTVFRRFSHSPPSSSATAGDYEYVFDIVYSYVNGSDLDQFRLKNEWFARESVEKAKRDKKKTSRPSPSHSIHPGLVRDNHELCYSLRSIDKYFPSFQGDIYIVADQIPYWLDVNHPRIHIVPTASIVDKAYYPTFSSHVIEANIHKIPGLRDYYIYFCDDYALGNKVTTHDFFTKDGCLRFANDGRRTNWPAARITTVHQQAMVNVNALLNAAGVSKRSRGVRYLLPHSPHILYKPAVERMWDKFAAQHHALCSHRFRSFKDLHPNYMATWYTYENKDKYCSEMVFGAHGCQTGSDYCLIVLDDNVKRARMQFRRLKQMREQNVIAKFLSINDHTTDEYPHQSAIMDLFALFMKRMFPRPSQYEFKNNPCKSHINTQSTSKALQRKEKKKKKKR